MRRTRLISLTAATGLLEAIEAAGGNPEQIARSVALTPAAVSKPDGFIPCAQFARLLDEAAHATGDDCFGLHFGERFNPKDTGPVAYVMINSPTIEAGFQNVGRYLSVHNQAAEVSFGVDLKAAENGHVHMPATDQPERHRAVEGACAG